MSQKALQALRQKMQAQSIDACVVYYSDPHMSEYLPEHWQARVWLSDFTGSAGDLVVTQDQAALWTDGRYWIQAEKQLQSAGVQLMKAGRPETPTMAQWLNDVLPAQAVVLTDGACVSVDKLTALKKQLSPNLTLQTAVDWLADVWQDRPPLPNREVYIHDMEFAGVSVAEKIAQVRHTMQTKKVDYWLVSSLDDIAYLTNLRGQDVDFNPVFLSYLLVGQDTLTLYVNEVQLNAEVRTYLDEQGIQVQPYQAVSLAHLPAGARVWIDPARTAVALLSRTDLQWHYELNPSQLMKACKTPQQIQHVREAMVKDGVALALFFSWFEKQQQVLKEEDIHDKLTAMRALDPDFISPSFGTIAGFNENGALPHYHAEHGQSKAIEGNGLLLIDSGGQYVSGTTDITRVLPIGHVSDEQKRDFTYVLKAMIQLSLAVFPAGIASPLLDTIARTPLWKQGLDFSHGTGHGVGYFLNVHEGPQVISHYALYRPHTAMLEGMITSNEPGLYRAGQWGIRIENLVVAVPHQKTEFGEYLQFETLTLCPIDTRCIEKKLLTCEEIDWLNDYHKQVYQCLNPHLSGDALDWLKERTKAI